MKPEEEPRLEDILRMLVYISQGNFDYRIPRTEADDTIESIIVMTNMMVEEMREILRFYTDLHINDALSQHIHMVFILDHNFQILFVTKDVLSEFGYTSEELISKPFSSLIACSHLNSWDRINRSIFQNPEYNEQHRLFFQNKEGMERRYSCVLTSIYDVSSSKKYLMASIYEPLVQSKILEDKFLKILEEKSETPQKQNRPPNVLISSKDRKIMREIHHYLLKHLDQPFPGLQNLANQFGTNEFKLKYGFKQLYGTSVFRFFKEERLKKAFLLIKETELPIKIVAKMCGYSNSAHFAKDFKNKYLVKPREIRMG